MIPGSDEWNRLVTASKVAAILGVSPWESPRSIWHRMRGDVPREETNEVQRRGHYLEPAILAWWRDQHDIGHDEGREYHLQPEYLLGDWAAATPDMAACHPDDDTVLVEAKSAAYDDDWGDPGTDAIPDYYLAQTHWQMHVSGIHRCYVPIITSRLRFAEYVVDYDAEMGAVLEQRMRAFYDSLATDEPPRLDDSTATFNVIRKLHPEIDRDESVEVAADEARELAEAAASLKAAEARDRLARSVVIEQMGRARLATCQGAPVARRQANKSGVSFVVTAKPENFHIVKESA